MSRRILHIPDFSRELITNMDTGDLPSNAARRFENFKADQRGKMRSINGYKSFASGPTAIAADVRWFEEVVLNDTQVLLCWGLDSSSIQHIYYSIDTGVTWVEITEVHQDTINSASSTSTTNFVLTTGNVNIADGWFVIDDSSIIWDIVTNYTHGTKTVLSKWGINTIAGNPPVNFFRFPFIDSGVTITGQVSTHRNLVRDPANFKPSIVQRQEGVSIITGRKQDSVTFAVKNFRNLWFGYVDTGDVYDDVDLNYTNYHAEPKLLSQVTLPEFIPQIISSTSAVAASPDALDVADYGIVWTVLFDEYQESDLENIEGDLLIQETNRQAIASGQHLRINISVDKLTSEALLRNLFASRRVTAIRCYLCKVSLIATTPNNEYEPITPFFLVKEIDVTDTSWSGTGPYTLTIDIEGRHWNAGQAFEQQFNRGHLSKLWVNSDFATTVSGREIVGSIAYGGSVETIGGTPDEILENQAYLISCAVNSALRATPDVLPISDIVNMGEYGIYKINALKEIGNQLAVFGENRLQIMAFNGSGTLVPVDGFDGFGMKGLWSAFSNGKSLFFGNQDSIYIRGRVGEPQEVGYPIRSTWQGISTRSTSIAFYKANEEIFGLYAGGTSYLFDSTRSSWRSYLSNKTWTWLTQGVDGEVLACDGTDIFELFSSTGTESMTSTYEKDFEFEVPVSFNQFWLSYTSSDLVKVFVYNLEKSDMIPVIEPLFFYPQTSPKTQKHRATFEGQRIRVKIEKQSSSNYDTEINFYSMYGTPKTVESDD